MSNLKGGTFQFPQEWSPYLSRIAESNDTREDCYSCLPIAFSMNGYNYYFGHAQNNMSENTKLYEDVFTFLLNFMVIKAEAI